MAERSSEGDHPSLADLSDVSNVLLLAPPIGGPGPGLCFDLLSQTAPNETNVMAILFTSTPGEWIEDWIDHTGVSPVRGGIVSVGQAEATVEKRPWTVETVENPADLTRVGIELSDLLSGLETAAADEEHIVVCFDSVTSLLQYADLQQAFRFLHVVTGRITTVGGVGHFHLDPEAHDRQTIATLRGLFDAVIEVQASGEWTLQQ